MQQRFWLALLLVALCATVCRADNADTVLSKAQSSFAQFGDSKVHYNSLGHGTTAVVFIHGWCCDRTVWYPQAAAFNGKMRMLFIDLPGYGLSDKPKADYTVDRFARGVDAVLKDAGVDQVVLVGHSMGVPVVVEFYRLFPRKTKALVFVDGALRPFTTDPAMIKQFMSRFQEATFKQTVVKTFAGMMVPSTPAAARKHINSMIANADTVVAISSMRGMLDPNIWREDPIRVPSQALMAKSPLWNDDYKRFARKLVPGLDYRVFEGVGHFLFMEKPAEFNAALAEFLRKQGVIQ